MLDSPVGSPSYVYNYRNKKEVFTGTPFNTAGWTSVEVAGQILEKNWAYFSHKISRSLLKMYLKRLFFKC